MTKRTNQCSRLRALVLYKRLTILYFCCIIVNVPWRKNRGSFAHYFLKEELPMVNPKTAIFVLDLIATVATAAIGVVVKHYIDVPKG